MTIKAVPILVFYFASADAWSCYECKIMNASIILLIYWVHKMKALHCGLKFVNLSNLILFSLERKDCPHYAQHPLPGTEYYIYILFYLDND